MYWHLGVVGQLQCLAGCCSTLGKLGIMLQGTALAGLNAASLMLRVL